MRQQTSKNDRYFLNYAIETTNNDNPGRANAKMCTINIQANGPVVMNPGWRKKKMGGGGGGGGEEAAVTVQKDV